MEEILDFVIRGRGGPIVLSYVSAVFVGLIVSLDVCGLILSQYHDYNHELKHPWKQAFLHAFWHAFLFFTYMIIISLIIGGAPQLLVLLKDVLQGIWQALVEWARQFPFALPQFPKVSEDAMRETLVLLAGMVVILIVWKTYSEKLIEDHSEKTDATTSPLAGQRGDVQLIYQIIRMLPIARSFIDNALALAVAVDMLAISALIRVYFKDSTDSGYQGEHFQFWYHEDPDQTDGFFPQRIIFAVVIFAVVFIVSWLVARTSRRATKQFPIKVLVTLRLLEPFLVFLILAFAISHLIQPPNVELVSDLHRNFGMILLAAALCASLFLLHGWKKIRKAVEDGANIKGPNTIPPRISVVSQLKILRAWLGNHSAGIMLSAAFSLLFMLLFIKAHFEVQERAPPLNIFVNDLSFSIGWLCVVLLYAPPVQILWPKFNPGLWEINFAAHRKGKGPLFRERWREFFYAAIGYGAVLIYTHFSRSGAAFWDFRNAEMFLQGLFWLGLFIGGCFGLVSWRESRQLSAHQRAPGTAAYEITLSEILTAFGVYCFLWQFFLRPVIG